MQEVTKKRNDAVGRKKQSLSIALTRDLFWPTVDEHHRFPFGNPAALPPPKGVGRWFCVPTFPAVCLFEETGSASR